jgi:cytochrome c biogenesis protein CcmG/thiol:disulfide interchange protein DsbE
MNMNRAQRTLAAPAMALLVAVACASPASVDAALTTSVAVLGSDETTTIAELADGRPAVVNFWATWCEFCIDEMPALEAVWVDLDGAVTFVGVDREDRAEDALVLAAETGVTYPLVEDPDGSLFRQARGLGMPTTLFVTGAGVIVHRHSGPLTEGQLRDLIEAHLGVTA